MGEADPATSTRRSGPARDAGRATCASASTTSSRVPRRRVSGNGLAHPLARDRGGPRLPDPVVARPLARPAPARSHDRREPLPPRPRRRLGATGPAPARPRAGTVSRGSTGRRPRPGGPSITRLPRSRTRWRSGPTIRRRGRCGPCIRLRPPRRWPSEGRAASTGHGTPRPLRPAGGPAGGDGRQLVRGRTRVASAPAQRLRLAGPTPHRTQLPVDGWIDPPLYTRLPPLVVAMTGETPRLRAPVNSTLIIRIAGHGEAVLAPRAGLKPLPAKVPPAARGPRRSPPRICGRTAFSTPAGRRTSPSPPAT